MRPQRPLSANRWGAPQIGHNMSFHKLANGFTYDSKLLNATSTAGFHQANRARYVAEAKKASSGQRGRASYSAWMSGRRTVDFLAFCEAQLSEIHYTAFVYCGRLTSETNLEVCSCGLVCEVAAPRMNGEFVDHRPEPLRRPGHVRTSDQTLQTLFLIRGKNGSDGAVYQFFCQNCDVLGDDSGETRKATDLETKELLAKLRSTHVCVPAAKSEVA